MSLATITDLVGYINTYGDLLGRKAIGALAPLYVPGAESDPVLAAFLREPLFCQKNVIVAASRAFAHHRALIICGEMGTGKSLMGAAAVHQHAAENSGGKYRAIILCPDHLIDKWVDEILDTIPNARVVTFAKTKKSGPDDSYKGLLRYVAECKSTDSVQKVVTGVDVDLANRWKKPAGAEWVIMGRDQAKAEGGWEAIGDPAAPGCPGVVRKVVTGHEEAKDADGCRIWVDGKKKLIPITVEVVTCPKCGEPLRHETKDILIDPKVLHRKQAKQHSCNSRYLQEVHVDGRTPTGLDRISPLPIEFKKEPAGKTVVYAGRHAVDGVERTYEVRECGERFWSYQPTPRKFSPARIVQRKCKGLFGYMLLDEMHEHKESTTGQALASAKIMGVSRRVIGLTGTLIGGYAHHLFPLLMRMAPRSLINEGFDPEGSHMPFAKVYGRIDTTYTTTYKEGKQLRARKRGQTSMARDGVTTKDEDVRPGVMPSFFGRHLIGKAMFLGLAEMDSVLPKIVDDDRSLIGVDMDHELSGAYHNTAEELTKAVNELLVRGSQKLLGTFLQTLLGYPDMPYDWRGPYPDRDAIGYHHANVVESAATWIDVTQPPDLSKVTVRNKERALIDLCKKEKAEGRQVWVYCMMTKKRDVQVRLQSLLEEAGLKVKILRDTSAPPRDRLRWINKNAPGVDVMISHPQLVSTGIDFFNKKDWSFNFATIVFYQGDYQTNRVRQAGRRHWRLGQPLECRTFYLYYHGTMQERQIKLVGDKFSAAKSLEGKFSAEGLAALAGEGSEQMALAKSLTARIEDTRSGWAKMRVEEKEKIAAVTRTGVFTRLADAYRRGDHDVRAGATGIGRLIVERAIVGPEVRMGDKPLSRAELAGMFDDLATFGGFADQDAHTAAFLAELNGTPPPAPAPAAKPARARGPKKLTAAEQQDADTAAFLAEFGDA